MSLPTSLDWDGKKLIIAMPITRTVNPWTMFSVFCLQDIHAGKIGLDIVTETNIIQGRNLLATRFLQTKADFMFFLDDDILPPCGRPEVYRDVWDSKVTSGIGSTDVLQRLMSHGLPLIGGLYFGRNHKGKAQYAEAFDSPNENNFAHLGNHDQIKPTRWVATGAMLIHRSVFEAINEKSPEVLPQHKGGTGGWFTPFGADQGEDVAFCARAKKAGIQPYVDLGCECGHLGSYPYWHHNTAPM